MRIRLGYDIKYECAHPTPMLLLFRVHPSRETDLPRPDEIVTEPGVPSPTSTPLAICVAASPRRLV